LPEIEKRDYLPSEIREIIGDISREGFKQLVKEGVLKKSKQISNDTLYSYESFAYLIKCLCGKEPTIIDALQRQYFLPKVLENHKGVMRLRKKIIKDSIPVPEIEQRSYQRFEIVQLAKLTGDLLEDFVNAGVLKLAKSQPNPRWRLYTPESVADLIKGLYQQEPTIKSKHFLPGDLENAKGIRRLRKKIIENELEPPEIEQRAYQKFEIEKLLGLDQEFFKKIVKEGGLKLADKQPHAKNKLFTPESLIDLIKGLYQQEPTIKSKSEFLLPGALETNKGVRELREKIIENELEPPEIEQRSYQQKGIEELLGINKKLFRQLRKQGAIKLSKEQVHTKYIYYSYESLAELVKSLYHQEPEIIPSKGQPKLLKKKPKKKPGRKPKDYLTDLTNDLVRRVKNFAGEREIDLDVSYNLSEIIDFLTPDFENDSNQAFNKCYALSVKAETKGLIQAGKLDLERLSSLDFILLYFEDKIKENYEKLITREKIPFANAEDAYEEISGKAKEIILEQIEADELDAVEELIDKEEKLDRDYEKEVETVTDDLIDRILEYSNENNISLKRKYMLKELTPKVKQEFKDGNTAYPRLYTALQKANVKFEDAKSRISGLDFIIFRLGTKIRKELKEKLPYTLANLAYRDASNNAKKEILEQIKSGDILGIIEDEFLKEKPKTRKKKPEKPKTKKEIIEEKPNEEKERSYEKEVELLTGNLVDEIKKYANEENIDLKENYFVKEFAELVKGNYRNERRAKVNISADLAQAQKLEVLKFEDLKDQFSGLDVIVATLGNTTIKELAKRWPYKFAQWAYRDASKKAKEIILEEIKTKPKTKEKKLTVFPVYETPGTKKRTRSVKPKQAEEISEIVQEETKKIEIIEIKYEGEPTYLPGNLENLRMIKNLRLKIAQGVIEQPELENKDYFIRNELSNILNVYPEVIKKLEEEGALEYFGQKEKYELVYLSKDSVIKTIKSLFDDRINQECKSKPKTKRKKRSVFPIILKEPYTKTHTPTIDEELDFISPRARLDKFSNMRELKEKIQKENLRVPSLEARVYSEKEINEMIPHITKKIINKLENELLLRKTTRKNKTGYSFESLGDILFYVFGEDPKMNSLNKKVDSRKTKIVDKELDFIAPEYPLPGKLEHFIQIQNLRKKIIEEELEPPKLEERPYTFTEMQKNFFGWAACRKLIESEAIQKLPEKNRDELAQYAFESIAKVIKCLYGKKPKIIPIIPTHKDEENIDVEKLTKELNKKEDKFDLDDSTTMQGIATLVANLISPADPHDEFDDEEILDDYLEIKHLTEIFKMSKETINKCLKWDRKIVKLNDQKLYPISELGHFYNKINGIEINDEELANIQKKAYELLGFGEEQIKTIEEEKEDRLDSEEGFLTDKDLEKIAEEGLDLISKDELKKILKEEDVDTTFVYDPKLDIYNKTKISKEKKFSRVGVTSLLTKQKDKYQCKLRDEDIPGYRSIVAPGIEISTIPSEIETLAKRWDKIWKDAMEKAEMGLNPRKIVETYGLFGELAILETANKYYNSKEFKEYKRENKEFKIKIRPAFSLLRPALKSYLAYRDIKNVSFYKHHFRRNKKNIGNILQTLLFSEKIPYGGGYFYYETQTGWGALIKSTTQVEYLSKFDIKDLKFIDKIVHKKKK